ncbi:P-loop NTPase fold protein [Microbacterium sp. USHLN272]|uniref:P-loop NTPase fold protein n=1 Tax=Microbacterium sp. USHLN272 TaxID=3081287 RepID=UPI003016EEAA
MNTAPTRIPILVDTPTADPRLGFEKYVAGISAAVLGGHPPRYTIGLYGPWGSGKSSLLEGLAKNLSEGENPPVVVQFDAWRYEASSDLLLPLLVNVRRRLDERASSEGGSRWRGIHDRLASVVSSLQVSFFGVTVSANTTPTKGRDASDEYFLPFESLTSLASSIAEDQRIVVLIDDLDRCAPDKVINIIEAIHILTDVPGLVFVLALDYGYLTSAIRRQYASAEMDETEAERYIEKVIQVPFHIPRMVTDGARVEDLIPSWADMSDWFPGVGENTLFEIYRYGLRSNPRQFKRLLNTYLLARHMSWAEGLDATLMLRVLGLQLSWPQTFDDIAFEIRGDFAPDREELRRLGDLELYKLLASQTSEENDGPRLRNYLSRVMTADLRLPDIDRIMTLARSVNDATSASLAQDAGDDGEVETSYQRGVRQASDALVAILRELQAFSASLADAHGKETEQRDTSTYSRSALIGPDGRKRVFASFKVLSQKNRLNVWVPLDADAFPASPHVRNVKGIGHHGVGDTEISVNPRDESSVRTARELIQASYQSIQFFE